MSIIVSQHTVNVRENHPHFLSGPMVILLCEESGGHFSVQTSHGGTLANYLTRQMAQDYIQNFIRSVGGLGLVDRIKDLRQKVNISLLAAKHIVEANLDGVMTGDYHIDIERLAVHLRKKD